MTPDVVGVIHLAAVSRVDWCEKNTVDCLDVNERGTEIVLEALTDLNRHDNGQRWFVLASSAEVYGNTNTSSAAETSHKVPQNAYGESKLRAEQVVERYVEGVQKDESAGSLYAISLRLATVYGGAFDIVERLVPSLVTQAIAHQVIQIEGGEQQLDLIHIDDAVDAFLLAAEHLSRFQTDPSLKRTRTFVDTFNIASGTAMPVGDLLDKVLRYTRSKSPIRHIPMDSRFPTICSANTEKARIKLNFQASLSLDQGLLQFVKLFLQRNERALRKKIDTECGAASPTIKANALSEMYKLNNCQAHVHAQVRGELAVLGLPENSGDDTRWHVESRFPPYLLHTFVKTGPNGKPWLAISDDHFVFLGIKRSAVLPTQGRVKVERIDRDGIDAGDYVDWEMEVNAAKGTLELALPDTSLQLKPPISPGGDFHLVSRELDIWPFRVTPICCDAAQPWPFFQEDPTVFQTEYQRTSLENPYLASAPKTLCDRLSRTRRKVQRDIATLSLELLDEPRREETLSPPLWADAELPLCSNSCDIPTVCVDTGNCQCAMPSCPTRQRFPFSSPTHSSAVSYPNPDSSVLDEPNSNPLMYTVQRSSWLDALRPQAAKFIRAGLPLLKVHVGELHPEDAQWRQALGTSITRLKDLSCFSADSSLEYALSLGKVTKEEADYTYIPVYQGREGYDRQRTFRTYDYNRDTNPFFDPEKAIMPVTYDWGICSTFEWTVWDLRKKKGLDIFDIKQLARLTTLWTPMGDLNSPCFRPHQDVVIPPRTCLSPHLATAFADMSKVRPVRDRSVLVSFSGSLWGTGIFDRMKLICSRPSGEKFNHIPNRRLFTNQDPLRTLFGTNGNYSYTELINDTIFCAQPAGTTSWASRLIDTMYGGCIPIFIGESALRPFHDIIDWSKISVRISAGDINRIEEILLTRYSLEDLEKMQAKSC